MSGALQAVFQNQRSFGAAPGQQAYTTAGTYSWVAPVGVTKVSVVAVGAGAKSAAGGGGGGGLGYLNNTTVVAGNSYAVVVGTGAVCTGGFSRITLPCSTVTGIGGNFTTGGGFSGIGVRGGTGGNNNGGAGGYAGNGGAGIGCGTGASGSGGGGGGSGGNSGQQPAARYNSGGGGVGILGQGASGAGGTNPPGSGISNPGVGGSGGATGGAGSSNYNPCFCCLSTSSGGVGGAYGGGGGDACGANPTEANGGVGAVRIIWPGCARSFPSTRTADE